MTERVLGPTGSPRRRWTLLLPLIAVCAIGVLYIAGAQAVNATGAFQLDGNAVTANPPPGDDWDRVCHEVVGSDCSTSSDTTGANAVSWIDANADPIIFTGGGSKDPQDPQDSWLWKPSDTIPDKDTIEHAFAARYSLPTSATTCPSPTTTCDVIFFGVDRFDNSGDAQLGFWFFKNEVARTDPPVSSQGGFKFTGHHANGDLLVISDFSNGGGTSTISAFFWDDTCAKAANNNPQPEQCAAANLRLKQKSDAANCATSAATAAFCGIVNPNNGETAPWEFLDKSGNSTYLQGEFYEAGINLSTLGIGGTCFASFEAESRASTSPTATLKALAIGSFGGCASDLTSQQKWLPNDQATVTVTGATTWSGTLKFTLYNDGTCGTSGGSAQYTQGPTNVGNATTFPVTTNNTTAFGTPGGSFSWSVEFVSSTKGVDSKTKCESSSLTITD